MRAGTLDRQSLLLAAIFPMLAAGLLNEFWVEPAYRRGIGWFYVADAIQWIVVPGLVWLFVLRPGRIEPNDYGLDFAPYARRPLHAIALFLFVALLLWIAYEPVKSVALRFLGRYANTFGYENIVPTSLLGKVVVVAYFSGTAALVEEVAFRGLPWAYLSTAIPPAYRRFWYITLTSLLFAATHAEQGPHGVIAAFTFGIMAAFLYTRLQNLWPLIFGHCVGDALSFWPT